MKKVLILIGDEKAERVRQRQMEEMEQMERLQRSMENMHGTGVFEGDMEQGEDRDNDSGSGYRHH